MKLSEQYKIVKNNMYTDSYNGWKFICNSIVAHFRDYENLLKDFQDRYYEAEKFSKKHNISFTGKIGVNKGWWIYENWKIRIKFLDHIIQELESQGL